MAAARNIAMYGAGGDNIGKFIIERLVLEHYNVTVIARQSSKSTYHPSARLVRVGDDLPHDDLVKALQGQDVVISTVGSANRGPESQVGVIDAAIEAGVKRFFPTEYGFDNGDPKSAWLSPIFKVKTEIQRYLEDKVKQHPDFSWTAVATGIWLEWALPINFLGINPSEQTVSYWDEGTHAPTHTTLPYAAQGVVEALKHPELTKNKRVYLEAFAASQRDIVAELERQQGVEYTVGNPINGAAAVRDAHIKLEASDHQDSSAAYTTVTAQILMKEYGADFRKAGKSPMVEDFAEMPKITLQDVIKTVVSRVK